MHTVSSVRQMLAAELPEAQACINVNAEENVELAPYSRPAFSKS